LQTLRPLAVSLIVLLLAAELTGCWLLYRSESKQIADRQAELEVVRVNLLSQLWQSELRPVANNLRALADGDGLRAYLQSGQQSSLQAAIHRAIFTSTQNPSYQGVRYIEQDGREIIRVDQGGELAAPNALQNKSDRRYFREASVLDPGALFISAFEPNVERGQIEYPPKPVVRFAAPVFDANGQRRGIYVINYLGAGIVTRLQQAAESSSQRLRLLNANGYWLKADDPRKEWGFALPGRSGMTLARSDPGLWAQLQKDAAGQARRMRIPAPAERARSAGRASGAIA
jgi:hypothetical protein